MTRHELLCGADTTNSKTFSPKRSTQAPKWLEDILTENRQITVFLPKTLLLSHVRSLCVVTSDASANS